MRRLILLTVLALGATAARAESGLFYLGAGVTYSSLIADNNGYIAYGTPRLANASWKAFAGVRPLNRPAVEADYIDLGSGETSSFSNESTDTTHAESSAWAVYAIGFCRFRCRAWTSTGRWGSRAGSSSCAHFVIRDRNHSACHFLPLHYRSRRRSDFQRTPQ